MSRGIILGALHDEVVPPDELALPYEKRLYPRLVLAFGHRYGIQVVLGTGIHLYALLLDDLLDISDLVP